MDGLLYIVSGPSGAGKSTLIKNSLDKVIGFSFSVSYTTREKRAGEIDGKDYFFIDKNTFFKMKEGGEFLEWAEVHGNYYATSKKSLEETLKESRGLVLDVDVQGALNIKKIYENAIYIFILPPSHEDLEKRLKKRGTESKNSLEKRLKDAEWEISHIKYFDYVIVNQEIEESTNQLISILVAEQLKRERFNESTPFFFKKNMNF
ncbi:MULTISPECIES: guanylate kinase [Petrotoga]|uniref:Guanylate kinase n=2 Tax=Petrotoga sibirica TaxID=156202 RepID=A0A4R8EV17_9BACT|nr:MULTISPECIES: guanylate kinase [Petrotoga]POZ89449.1 guanylate kinase [Petrotoga sibirica DSM 13575]POZ91891.1 guanylate kinase [Petrotoga sp. SL27]TDX16256.1 guanylate kinase [Petrotoga sibirica]